MTDRMAAMGERELVRDIREMADTYTVYDPYAVVRMLRRAADYIESLSAPVEDEEKLCREILARAIESRFNSENWAGEIESLRTTGSELFAIPATAALAAMREYARRLPAPVGVTVGEPALTGLEVTDEMVERALVAYTAADGGFVWPDDLPMTEAERIEYRGIMRAALTAALQANGVSGSPSSPIQTRELEEAEAIALGCGGLK